MPARVEKNWATKSRTAARPRTGGNGPSWNSASGARIVAKRSALSSRSARLLVSISRATGPVGVGVVPASVRDRRASVDGRPGIDRSRFGMDPDHMYTGRSPRQGSWPPARAG